MKLRDKQLYVDAMMPLIERRCKGKSLPVVMDALKLLNEACRLQDPALPNSYASGASERVVKDLFDEIHNRCIAQIDDEVFPCHVIKCTRSLIDGIGNNRELVVDEKFTPDWYSHHAYPTRGNPSCGFVFFNRSVTTQHPILIPSMKPRFKANNTEKKTLYDTIGSMIESKLLEPESASALIADSRSSVLITVTHQ
jgi:hypothetical protein